MAKKGNYKLLVGIGIALAVILIFVGINRFSGGGKQVVAKSLLNLIEAESYHTVAELKMNLPVNLGNRERPLQKFEIFVEGDVDNSQSAPQLTGDLVFEASGRGTQFTADGQLRLLSDSVAFRLDTLPLLFNPKGNLIEKWTYVNAAPLTTNNPEAVREVFAAIVSRANYVGRERNEGESVLRYSVPITPEEQDQVADVISQDASGNRGLNVLARLLRAYYVRQIQIDVNSNKKDLSSITLVFADSDVAEAKDKAILKLEFSEFGKEVVIDQPEVELTVRPEVFGKLFGTGEVSF